MDKKTIDLITEFALIGYQQGYMDATSILINTKPDIQKMTNMIYEKLNEYDEWRKEKPND